MICVVMTRYFRAPPPPDHGQRNSEALMIASSA
jgi:hypothetical protein